MTVLQSVSSYLIICFLPHGHSLLRKPFHLYAWHICSIRSLEFIFWNSPLPLYPVRRDSREVRSGSLWQDRLRSDLVLFGSCVTPAPSRCSLGFCVFIRKTRTIAHLLSKPVRGLNEMMFAKTDQFLAF